MDLVAEAIVVAITLVIFGDADRIWTSLFLAMAAICLYEAAGSWLVGASAGKRLVGLRLVSLDRRGRARPIAAVQRGAVTAAFTILTPIAVLAGIALVVDASAHGEVDVSRLVLGIAFLVGGLGAAAGWVAGTVGDALGRGVADRVAGTMVVPDRFAGTVATRDLPGYADGARSPRLTPLGRIADLDVRARARLRRITGSRLLAAAIGLLALTVSLPFTTGAAILASSAAWIAIFVGHETWLVHRTAATPGHTMAGLLIVDRRSGRPPSTVRAGLRALVLGFTLYIPLLWPLLAITALLMRFQHEGRGLHDLVGGTIVIADPSLSPEAQRQRSMRMRLGRVG